MVFWENLIFIWGMVSQAFIDIFAKIPWGYRVIINIGFFIYLAISSILFVWVFSKFLSRRDFIGMRNLGVEEDSGLYKFMRVFIYILELFIVLPVVIFLWFYFFASFLLFIPGISVESAINTTFILVLCCRLLSFLNEKIALSFTRSVGVFVAVIFFGGYFFLEVSGIGEMFFYLVDNLWTLLPLLVLMFVIELSLKMVFYLRERYFLRRMAKKLILLKV